MNSTTRARSPVLGSCGGPNYLQFDVLSGNRKLIHYHGLECVDHKGWAGVRETGNRRSSFTCARERAFASNPRSLQGYCRDQVWNSAEAPRSQSKSTAPLLLGRRRGERVDSVADVLNACKRLRIGGIHEQTSLKFLVRLCELSFREINAAEGKVGLRIEGFERENMTPRVFRLGG